MAVCMSFPRQSHYWMWIHASRACSGGPLAVSPDSRARLVDSIEICYREAGGEAILEFVAMPREMRRSAWSSTSDSNVRTMALCYQEPEPRLFSFNIRYGACPRCQVSGTLSISI